MHPKGFLQLTQLKHLPCYDLITNTHFPKLLGQQIKATYNQSKRRPKVSVEIGSVPIGHASRSPWQLPHSQ